MQDNFTIGRDLSALRRHYEVERELSDQLRSATAEQRRALYRTVYDELFRRIPDHPQHSRKADPLVQEARTREQLRLIQPFLRSNSKYMEIGAGDCHLPMTISRMVQQVYAVDVSEEIASVADQPGNFKLILSDGVSVGVPAGTIDVAYSNMLLEHLHPDDAVEHAREVFQALAPGGVYICRTPHRFAGPQDVSQFFDETATGFHLKEYTFRELHRLFLNVGFASTSPQMRVKGHAYGLPHRATHAMEGLLGILPHRPRKWLATSHAGRTVFNCLTIVAQKAP